MGDFLPKRKDLVERLRRRFELYRNRHQGISNRFEPYLAALYENSKQDTALLRERWFNSKAKKTKTVRKTVTNGVDHSNVTADHKGTTLPPGTNNNNNNIRQGQQPTYDSSNVYTFTDNDIPTVNKTHPGVDLSVQIVQNINSGEVEPGQRIETNVTVSSTLKPMPVSTADKAYFPQQQQQQQQHHPSPGPNNQSNVECKQEDNNSFNQCYENHSSIEFDKDMQALLETLEIPKDLLNELTTEWAKTDDGLQEVDTEAMNMLHKLDSYNAMKSNRTSTPDSQPTSQNTEQFDSNRTFEPSMNGITSQNSLPSYGSIPQQSMNMGDSTSTGPAAETLKQMAAQHQNQMPSFAPMKPDPLLDERFSQQHDFSNYPPNVATTSQNASMYTYAQQQTDVSAMNKQNAQLSYAGTKPLSHYNIQSPSSLQQLQNQVRSQFNPSVMTSFQMSQSQHMQVTHAGAKHMEISQAQEMLVNNQGQISAMQQQSMSMNGSDAAKSAQYEQQMKMHMYQQKLRQEQMMKQRHAQMQQYMSRSEYMKSAPPRYPTSAKMPTAPSPLQTMQNMVNQTPTDGGITDVPQTPMPPGLRGPPSHMMVNRMPHMQQPPEMMSYQQQMYAKAPMNPAQQNAMARAMRSETPQYNTSQSHMAYNRPPNPHDSASLSHARNMAQWRMMTPAQRAAAHQQGGIPQHNPQSSPMMAPEAYQSQGHSAEMAAALAHRQQQNTVLMQQQQMQHNGSHMYPGMMNHGAPNPDPSSVPGQTVMMRQSMHMNMMNQTPPSPSIHPSAMSNPSQHPPGIPNPSQHPTGNPQHTQGMPNPAQHPPGIPIATQHTPGIPNATQNHPSNAAHHPSTLPNPPQNHPSTNPSHHPSNPSQHPSNTPVTYNSPNPCSPPQGTFSLDFLDSAQPGNGDFASNTDFNLLDEILGKG